MAGMQMLTHDALVRHPALPRNQLLNVHGEDKVIINPV